MTKCGVFANLIESVAGCVSSRRRRRRRRRRSYSVVASRCNGLKTCCRSFAAVWHLRHLPRAGITQLSSVQFIISKPLFAVCRVTQTHAIHNTAIFAPGEH